MRSRVPLLGSLLFFLVGPGLEAGAGPALLSAGWQTGHDWPGAVRVLGALLVATGLAVVVASFVGLARDGGGTPSPAAPTQRLVVRGVYRHLRHPMYVATAAMIAGQGLLLGRPILFVAAAAYVATLAALAQLREEPALLDRHGAAYADYRAAVPGWWPRLRPYAAPSAR